MAPAASLSDTLSLNHDALNLARALDRLERKILSPEPSASILHSSYERSKTAANLEYARTLLLRLEHGVSAIKIQSRKHALQSELLAHRALIKRLTARLYELKQQRDGHDEDDDGGDVEDEDLLGEEDAAASSPPRPTVSSPSRQARPEAAAAAAAATSATLRARRDAAPGPGASAFSTATAGPPSTTSVSRLVEYNDGVSADLQSSLLSLASQLKASALAFAEDLAADAATVGRTESALGKNRDGMDAATRRMGVLRRMGEGRWWWGRMLLYAAIFGLWVLAVTIVFVLPKLRI